MRNKHSPNNLTKSAKRLQWQYLCLRHRKFKWMKNTCSWRKGSQAIELLTFRLKNFSTPCVQGNSLCVEGVAFVRRAVVLLLRTQKYRIDLPLIPLIWPPGNVMSYPNTDITIKPSGS